MTDLNSLFALKGESWGSPQHWGWVGRRAIVTIFGENFIFITKEKLSKNYRRHWSLRPPSLACWLYSKDTLEIPSVDILFCLNILDESRLLAVQCISFPLVPITLF